VFKDIMLGQYVPVKSPLHAINPPLKIVFTILYMTTLFMVKTYCAYAVFTVYTLLLMFISAVPVRIILKGLRPMLWILVFTAVLNVFMTPGDAVWSMSVFGFTLKITREGLSAGALMVVRLIYLLIGTSLLTLTTSPLQLTDGIETLLRPFNKIRVPSHEIAMMMTIAIRFIPTLAEETDKIMKAQTARGADFETGNIIKRAKAMVPLLVPLFISAFRRADELATAMEARCYNGGKNRTKMKESRMTVTDLKAGVIFAAGLAVILLAEFWVYF
jgi:energy-coupling factor transport system permease protein